MIDLNFVIKGNQLIPKYPKVRKVTGNSANDLKCHFDFESEEWGTLNTRLAIFKSMSFNIAKLVTIASDGTCMIPWEVVCKPGVIICSVSGSDDTGNKIITNPAKVVLVTDFASIEVTYGNTPTPSEYEQFIQDVKAKIDEYFAAHNFKYEDLGDLPSIEGVTVEGDLLFSDFGYPVATVFDIDAMFE